MKTILFVLGGKVTNNQLDSHFLLRTQAALDYSAAHPAEDITFLVSGRWTSVTESYVDTEAEVAKQHILRTNPNAVVIKEDISVELIGNYAFSKPLITKLAADKVVIFTSEVNKPRNEALASRIFSSDVPYEFQVITGEHSDNGVLVHKEARAVSLFNAVFQAIPTGDDTGFRNALLYTTPYYFKGLIDDKTFFDTYWEGGFDEYIAAREVRKNV